MSQLRPITVTTPAATSPSERTARSTWPVTSAAAAAMIGVISGATIIAPMTVAVESPMTPAVAMIVDRTSSMPNCSRYGRRRSPSKNSLPSNHGTISGVNRFARTSPDSLLMTSLQSRPAPGRSVAPEAGDGGAAGRAAQPYAGRSDQAAAVTPGSRLRPVQPRNRVGSIRIASE